MGDVVLRDPVTGAGAHVDANQHQHVEAVNRDEKDQAARFGQKFNINTGDITITTANKHSVLYLKNTGDDTMVINSLIYNLGATASGTGDVLIEVLRNPTAGAIITNAVAPSVGQGISANQNFSSTNLLQGLIYKGANADTVISASDGVSISTRSAANTGRIVVSLGSLEIEKGASLAIDYTPPASNTSQKVQFALAMHVRTPKVAAV